jgi:23S rRNA pseudouridine1911/1915/1917 synthase
MPAKQAATRTRRAAPAGTTHASSKKPGKKPAKKATKKTPRKTVVKKPAPKKRLRRPKNPARVSVPAPVPETFRFTIDAADAGRRIDRFLGESLENASRTRIQKWMESGAVRVNGEPARKSFSLASGDRVEIIVPVEISGFRADPEDIPLTVVYEDKYLAVIDKPKGLVTHPGHGVPGGTLANALAYRYKALSDLGGADRPGIVHRLDRDTSGLLVIARDNATHAALSTDLAARKIRRTYRALVWREPSPEGTFDWPLGRHSKDPTKRAVWSAPDAKAGIKAAVTHYRVLDWYQFAAEVEVRLETGRTHQIRVHMAAIGHPLVGDVQYGAGFRTKAERLSQPAQEAVARLKRQALHAYALGFEHPVTGTELRFESPLPDDIAEVILAFSQM